MSVIPAPIWRGLKACGIWALALLILFEEWGWVPLTRALGLLAHWRVLAWLERRIAALPPGLALLVFFVPVLLLLPIKLGAWWLIGCGRALAGATVLVLAKVVGTGVVGRLFLLTRPQLLKLAWFARGYGRWLAWKRRILERVRAAPAWRRLGVALARARVGLRALAARR